MQKATENIFTANLILFAIIGYHHNYNIKKCIHLNLCAKKVHTSVPNRKKGKSIDFHNKLHKMLT